MTTVTTAAFVDEDESHAMADEPVRRRRAAPAVLYGVLSVIFCAPLFEHPQGLGVYDWDQHLFYYGVVLKNLVE